MLSRCSTQSLESVLQRTEAGTSWKVLLVADEPVDVVRVVVADDEPLVCAGISMILGADPRIEVVAEVWDGRSAIEATQQRHPHVVVMDLRMPDLDGVEATRVLNRSSDQVAVLALTTYNVDELVYAALRAGACGFLLKHAAPKDLVAAVLAVADGKGWLDPGVTRALLREFARSPDVPSASQAELALLTPREREILCLLASGLANADIAARLVVGEGTVKTHVSRVLAKLGVRDRAQATAVAFRSGLMPS